jgi:hypothetical protein
VKRGYVTPTTFLLRKVRVGSFLENTDGSVVLRLMLLENVLGFIVVVVVWLLSSQAADRPGSSPGHNIPSGTAGSSRRN